MDSGCKTRAYQNDGLLFDELACRRTFAGIFFLVRHLARNPYLLSKNGSLGSMRLYGTVDIKILSWCKRNAGLSIVEIPERQEVAAEYLNNPFSQYPVTFVEKEGSFII